jgi:hypothetical protein
LSFFSIYGNVFSTNFLFFSLQEKIMIQTEFYRGAISPGDCVSNGWNLVSQNFGLFLGISILGMILAGCIPCVSLFISGPIVAGIYYVFLRQMNGEPVDFGMMFKGFEVFVPAMVIGIIIAIPEIIGQGIRISINVADIGIQSQGDGRYAALSGGLAILAVVVGLLIIVIGFVIRISLFFALPLIMERKLSVGDAIKLSASAGWANFGGIFLLSILEGLMAIAGILVFCIGIFFVIPIIYAANAFAYRQVFPHTDQTGFNVPPPPTDYGFGQGM